MATERLPARPLGLCLLILAGPTLWWDSLPLEQADEAVLLEQACLALR
jgi:hypothetical protein